jgi:hypothetical protein
LEYFAAEVFTRTEPSLQTRSSSKDIYIVIPDQAFRVTVGFSAGALAETAAGPGKANVGLFATAGAGGAAGLSTTAGLVGEGAADGEAGAGGAGLSTTAGLVGAAALDGTAGARGGGAGATVGFGGGGATGLKTVGVEGPARALEAALTASVMIVELAEAPG